MTDAAVCSCTGEALAVCVMTPRIRPPYCRVREVAPDAQPVRLPETRDDRRDHDRHPARPL